MYFSWRLAFSFLSFLSSVSMSELDHDGWLKLKLSHSFDDSPTPTFTPKNDVTISSIRAGSTTMTQAAFSSSDINKLLALARNNGKYFVNATVQTSLGSEVSFLTSVLACNLLGSNLEDIMYIWLDSTGMPVAVNLISHGPCSRQKPITDEWNTEIQVKTPDSGPVPDTATYIQKLEREKLARESGEIKDNRSFFAKYWMYIVPTLIFFVLTSATNPEAGGGGGGGGARQ